MIWKSLAIAAGVLAGACASPANPDGPGGVTTGIQVSTGREFEIAAGQEAQVRGTNIVIRFVGVSEDSRCPSDVQCVWAGNALARFSLSTRSLRSDASLNTTLEPRSTSYEGYRVTLIGVKPAPRSGTTIPAASYVATLEVRPL